VLEPHSAEDPQSADDPHRAEFEVTNCEEPQTAVLPHRAELFHTEEGDDVMYTLPVVGS